MARIPPEDADARGGASNHARKSAALVPRSQERAHYLDATAGTIYGMLHKTTIYLPDELRAAIKREARRCGSSEADVIRRAVTAAVSAPRPQSGFLDSEPFATRTDELLAGFGER